MHIKPCRFDAHHLMGDSATHPLARPAKRRALSLLLAGAGLRRPRFAPDTRPDAPTCAPNYFF
jgi:hypothetical protein